MEVAPADAGGGKIPVEATRGQAKEAELYPGDPQGLQRGIKPNAAVLSLATGVVEVDTAECCRTWRPHNTWNRTKP